MDLAHAAVMVCVALAINVGANNSAAEMGPAFVRLLHGLLGRVKQPSEGRGGFGISSLTKTLLHL
jgi:hypothetical protein